MHKFKPGDKVKIISNKYINMGYSDYATRPYLIITKFHTIAMNGALYDVEKSNGYYVWEDDLQLVNKINLKLI